jgi:glutathione S-transferase
VTAYTIKFLALIDEQMTEAHNTLPILYSLRHCPYAMRARMAIFSSTQPVLLRAIKLSNKPPEMLELSSKGTVPMLVISAEEVLEESLDIMLKILSAQDPHDLLHQQQPQTLPDMLILIRRFDVQFKAALNNYKCAKRYRESNLTECRQACEVYIQELELQLNKHQFLMSEKESLVDIALLPFIRQFSKVERQWYQQSPYPLLRAWLTKYVQSPMFTKVMAPHPLWVECRQSIIFGDL